MPIQFSINGLAVLASAIVTMALGALWYSPVLFGKQWMALMGWTPDSMKEDMKKGVGKAYALMFASAFVMIYVLAHIIGYTNAMTVAEGLRGGFWMWLGFVVTTNAGSVLFEKRQPGVYAINMSYHLVVLLLSGAILAVWR